MIRVENVWKKYARHEALRGLSFSVPEGSAFALIGATGAGKTTTIKILMNIIEPTLGSASVLGVDADFARARDIHVHIPAGATPKDGPSAGIAIATALVSALSGAAVRGDTAMTGEVTLRGRVLPIGGLKEKLVAARRAGVAHIIMPAANARELDEIAPDIREGLTFHPVSTMDEVLSLALRADRHVDTGMAVSDVTH